MYKKITSLVAALALASTLSAYEQNGDVAIKWTGFKLASKVGVSGSFNIIESKTTPSDNFVEFLKSASVSIPTASFESNDKGRNENIISTLFSPTTAANISAKIVSVDESDKSMIVEITMNEVVNKTIMKYDVNDGKLIAKGAINVLDFNLSNPFLAFAKKCQSFHEGYSYPNVDLEFSLAFK